MLRLRVAAVTAAVLLGLLGTCAWVVDRVHFHDRIVSGGRIWHCELFGGSWPVEVAGVVQLEKGYALDRFGTVRASPSQRLVVAQVRDASGRIVGMGTWNVGDGIAAPRLGAVDDLARRLSGVRSDVRAAGHRAELRAARECSDRGLPR